MNVIIVTNWASQIATTRLQRLAEQMRKDGLGWIYKAHGEISNLNGFR